MLSEFFESPARIRGIRRGPSGALLESFANHLFEGACQPPYKTNRSATKIVEGILYVDACATRHI